MWYKLSGMVLAAAVVFVTEQVRAVDDVFNMPGGQTSLSFVIVGDPGNAKDPANGNYFGSVGYIYRIGTYEVTLAQYTVFLNAVAKTDPYGLYASYLAPSSFIPYGIQRSGTSGSFSYSVAGASPRKGDMPVFGISWAHAARFCNWLENGQPIDAEGPGTTETGAYTLNGATTNAALMAVARNTGATYFIPSEDEWYKAAYYKGGGTHAGYWSYPTQSDAAPDNALSTTGPNSANYYISGYADPTNRLTPVGYFVDSPGAYGTYDMAGDVWEWNETAVTSSSRGMRGGDFDHNATNLVSANRSFYAPTRVGYPAGFRLGSAVPEPSTLALLGVGAIGLLGCMWWWRKRTAT